MISMNKSCSPSPAGPRSSGVELLVVDDGWFVGRNSDTSSLGDWSEDPAKLPRGLAGLAEALAETGLALGLWIEPEMVSPASELYRRHPDWCLHQPTARHHRPRPAGAGPFAEGCAGPCLAANRLSAPKAPISYLKWDMNRHLTEVGSALLPPGARARQPTAICWAYTN